MTPQGGRFVPRFRESGIFAFLGLRIVSYCNFSLGAITAKFCLQTLLQTEGLIRRCRHTQYKNQKKSGVFKVLYNKHRNTDGVEEYVTILVVNIAATT